MEKRLSSLKAPALAGVIREKSVSKAVAEMKNCYYDGADMIDLHLSCLESQDKESLTRIIRATRLPVLALHYNSDYDFAPLGISEEERVASLLGAVEAGAAGIDMQAYTFDASSKMEFHGEDIYSFTKGNPREIVTDTAIIDKQCELIERVHGMGAEVLLSCHPSIRMPAEAVVELALFLEKRGADIIKIVNRSENEEDNREAERAMLLLKREIKTPISYHLYGRAGIPTRIINPLLGGQIAFCIDRYEPGSTMEQIDLRTARAAVDAARRLADIMN